MKDVTIVSVGLPSSLKTLMLYNLTFVLRSLFFFFLKIWSKFGVRIIHGRALYTGKYGNISFKVAWVTKETLVLLSFYSWF